MIALRRFNNAEALAVLGLGLGLDGLRPSCDVVGRLRRGLATETRAASELRAARCEVREAIGSERSEGATFFAIATGIVPASGNLRETTRKRERVAGNLRSRMFEARCRR